MATACRTRLDLAAAAGRHHAVPDDHEPQHRDADLADQDDHGDPPRELVEPRQADQRRADQGLVGDRVGDLAEVGDQPAPPGELAVEPVGQRRDAEDHGRRDPPAALAAVVVQQQHREDRHEQEPHEGQRVGDVPDADRRASPAAPPGPSRPPAGPVSRRRSSRLPRDGPPGRRPRWPRPCARGPSVSPATGNRRPARVVVEPSTSGPWWAAPGPRSTGRRRDSTSTSTVSPTRSSARCAVSSSTSADQLVHPGRDRPWPTLAGEPSASVPSSSE